MSTLTTAESITTLTIDFIYAHQLFEGKLEELCKPCHGKCEYEQIAIFLPHEVTYTAQQLAIQEQQFRQIAVTTVNGFGSMPMDLVRVGFCPILADDYHCSLEDQKSKPLACSMYPYLIRDTLVLDTASCAHAQNLPLSFCNSAHQLYTYLHDKIPAWWIDFALAYDHRVYRFDKLVDLSRKPVIAIEELDDCLVERGGVL